jgi:ElaB/YqjD/DUF883 family membrane-anchored ribosome-binding protein
MRGFVRHTPGQESSIGQPNRSVASKKVSRMKYEKSVSHLIDGAEELVHKLRNSQDHNIQRLRDRVDGFVVDAKQGKSDRQGSMRIARIPGSLREYVNRHPFLAVLTAASLAWTLGHLSSAASDRTAHR